MRSAVSDRSRRRIDLGRLATRQRNAAGIARQRGDVDAGAARTVLRRQQRTIERRGVAGTAADRAGIVELADVDRVAHVREAVFELQQSRDRRFLARIGNGRLRHDGLVEHRHRLLQLRRLFLLHLRLRQRLAYHVRWRRRNHDRRLFEHDVRERRRRRLERFVHRPAESLSTAPPRRTERRARGRSRAACGTCGCPADDVHGNS